MKKPLSYVLPTIALVIIVFLAFRWLRGANNQGSITPTAESAEGIQISDLTGDEEKPTGMKDQEVVKLTQPSPAAQVPEQGEVRYSPSSDNKTQFTVSADLPELKDDSSFYQLWVEGDKGRKKAMRLVYEKGGYITGGSLSSEFDKVKVIISKETKDDDEMEEVQLEGTINLKKDQQ